MNSAPLVNASLSRLSLALLGSIGASHLAGPLDLKAQAAGFFDQYAKSVSQSVGTADPDAALGPPDHEMAMINPGGALILDLGPGLDRLSDQPGTDLVVFETDPAFETDEVDCGRPHSAEYRVEVAEVSGGPFAKLGEVSGARRIGDEFDLLAADVASARFVSIAPAGSVPFPLTRFWRFTRTIREGFASSTTTLLPSVTSLPATFPARLWLVTLPVTANRRLS